MTDWRCSGVWSQYFATSTCATRPGPGRPRSIGSDGIGACTMVSQDRQLSFGRRWRITLKLEGTYSSTSRSSWPIRLKVVSPQPGQLQAGSWVTVSRGRCSGSGWRFIDPDARFKFVPAKGYVPESGELRFDMYDGEYTHKGDRCTFEV